MKLSKEAEAELQNLAHLGELKASVVVDIAKNIANPLHEYFDWDDKSAAYQHRLSQARMLIRSVKVTVTTTTNVIAVPRYVHDPGAPKQQEGYVEVTSLRSDADRARNAVRAELQRARTALQRANAVAAALGLQGEMERLINDISVVVAGLDGTSVP